jgi:EAL domain-containing protein (putative c-di-GMP-specific phosphodiesterase class I)
VLPTVADTIDSIRAPFVARGELTVTYCSFVRFAKIEGIYGWEKLDAVIETATRAVQSLPESGVGDGARGVSRAVISYPHDGDIVFLHVPATGEAAADDQSVTALASRVQRLVADCIVAEHGDDIAALVEVYAGRAHVVADPKVRYERLVYRGIRDAANAAKSLEQRERARKVGELRESLRNGAIYIDYHPIVVAESGQVFGYEALARGIARSLRSPEVMFEVAADADLIWQLSRLCRTKAIEGLKTRLGPDDMLFLNVDPHDFDDPQFTDIGAHDPRRVVIEITERTAIKDYPRIRERLRAFRERGYRFAVDDAGSGYAGLGSIANLEPDFIKLDISLINGIDSNASKQRLVETMVRFANQEGARVIAEGVERAEEFAAVKRLGVHLVQGFFLQPREGGGTPGYKSLSTKATDLSAAPRP